MGAYAFLSYQTADRHVAGRLKAILAKSSIEAFMAHEDIDVSYEWRIKILEEIERADIFICILSKDYMQSYWCIQESGIAAFRKMTTIPLSIDGTTPEGFLNHVQATKVDPNDISLKTLLPGFLKHDFSLGIEMLIDVVGRSGGYRIAEANFAAILPYLPKMSDVQIKALLERSAENDQVYDAGTCARVYIPPLLKSHGHLLDKATRKLLEDVCERYA